jgi:hypothetical protein
MLIGLAVWSFRAAAAVDELRLELEMWKEKYRKKEESSAEALADRDRLVSNPKGPRGGVLPG